jgi:hypothetical protein
MAKTCITCWTACLKELQRLADAAVIAQTEVRALGVALEELSQQPQPLPHAAWKKLVQDVQVTCADTGNNRACVHGGEGRARGGVSTYSDPHAQQLARRMMAG